MGIKIYKKIKPNMNMKKIYLNIIATIIFLFLIAGSLFLETWAHEEGHIAAAKKYGINFHIDIINYKFDPEHPFEWGGGRAVPSSTEDCEKHNVLPISKQRVISHAGVKMQLIIFIPLFLISLISCYAYRNLWNTHFLLCFFIALLAILFGMIIIGSIWGNVIYQDPLGPLNDWHVVNISNCSRFG
jgi:hypothetical protein